MRAMPLLKITAFVEGIMERTFLNFNFKYVDVVTMQNGRDWTVESICEQLRSKFRVKNSNSDLFVVWIDKEKQNCDHEIYENKIRDTLTEEGVPPDKIAILLPDQMTENTILADTDLIISEFDIEDYQYEAEGTNGKHRLKRLFESKGVIYKETFHGVDLLKRCRVSRAAVNSASVKRFQNNLPEGCWWIG